MLSETSVNRLRSLQEIHSKNLGRGSGEEEANLLFQRPTTGRTQSFSQEEEPPYPLRTCENK